MPHLEDEHANYFQAKVFARGRITNPVPPVREAFPILFVLTQDGKQFAKYPPGFPLLLMVGSWLNQPWVVNSVAAALGLLATYLLGRDLFDRQTGLLAAALGAISPMYVMLSGTLLPHTTCLASLVFFAWCFVRARQPTESHRNAFAWAAGVLGGLALIIRPWTAFGIGLPFAVLVLTDLARKRGAAFGIYWRMLIAFGAVGALWPLYTFMATGNPLANIYTMYWDYDAVGFGSQFGTGHYWEQANLILSYGLDMFRTTLTGWPVVFDIPLAWLVIGVGVVLPPRTRIEPALLIPPAMLVIAYFAYWASSTGVFGPRYYAEGMPFLWLLVAHGLIKASAWRIGRGIVKIALPLCVIWGIFFSIFPRFLEAKGIYGISREDSRRIAASGICHALVFVQSDWWTDYANPSWLNAVDLQDGDIIFAEDRGAIINEQVMQHFPGRTIYYYDRHQVNPLIPGDTILHTGTD